MNEVLENSLPKGWRVGTVGETGEYINGLAFKPEDWHEEGMPIIRIQNLTNPDKPFNVTTREVDELYIVNPGDILVSWSATLDAFVWHRNPAILNQHIFKVVPNTEVVNDRFLFYMLKRAIAEMIQSEHLHGSTMKHINRKPFLAHQVPIPPIEQQKRIVAKIEELFSHIDAGIEALNKAKQLLKQYRQSVLKAAVTGELTKEWREVNKDKLLDKNHLKKLIDEGLKTKKKIEQNRVKKYRESDWFYDCSKSIPQEWEQVRLIDVTRLITCGVAKRPEYVEQGIPFLSAQNSKPFAPNLKGIKQVSESDFKTYTVGGKPDNGDVLYSRVGANFGEACVIPWDFDFAIYVSLTLIKQDRSILDGRYLTIFLNSYDGVLQSRGGIMGSGIQNLNVDSVRKYRIPITSLDEQLEIVRVVDEKFAVIDRLEAEIDRLLTRSVINKQAILFSAFSGKV